MSLQVWLPFNNTIQNQGLNGDYALQAGTTAYTTGLITPKCLNVTSTTSALKYPLLADEKSYSVSGWFKVTAYSSYNTLFCNGSDNGNGWYVRCNGSIGNLIFQCFNKTATYTSFSAGKWFHICVVINASTKNAYLYVNGSLAATITGYTQGTSYASGGFNIGKLRDTFYHLNGLVNDFRIYDHCLSLKEVKELSKGLCLHYKLSRGGENLLKNTSTEKSFTYAGGSSYVDSNYAQDTITPPADSYYTMSFDAKGSDNGSYFKTYLYNNNSGRQCDKTVVYRDGVKLQETTSADGYSGSIPLDTAWHHFEIVRHFNSNTTALTKQNVFRLSGNSSSYTVYIRNAKIEEGDHATSWIPNKADAMYSALGYNNIEPDCSGYGNDGSINGTLTYSNDTSRYLGSSYFGYTQNVQGNFVSPSTPITISFWAKVSQFDTSGWVVLAGQNTSYYLDADASSGGNWHSNATVQSYYRDGALVASANSVTKFISRDGNWHHYVYVCTLTNWTKMTVNGGSLWGSSWRANSNISDFRIYATALSATDIKSLYNESASLCDNYSFMVREVVEQ